MGKPAAKSFSPKSFCAFSKTCLVHGRDATLILCGLSPPDGQGFSCSRKGSLIMGCFDVLMFFCSTLGWWMFFLRPASRGCMCHFQINCPGKMKILKAPWLALLETATVIYRIVTVIGALHLHIYMYRMVTACSHIYSFSTKCSHIYSFFSTKCTCSVCKKYPRKEEPFNKLGIPLETGPCFFLHNWLTFSFCIETRSVQAWAIAVILQI